MLVLLLILAALVCFGVPAVLNRGFDYTNTGLFCLALTYAIGVL